MRKQITRLNLKPTCENHNTWVCTLCYPFALEIGKVYAFGSLIYMRNHTLDTLAPAKYGTGTYAILQGQGHRDGEMTFLTEKPTNTYNKKFKYHELTPGYLEMHMGDAIHLFNIYVKEKFVKPNIDSYQFSTFFITKLANLVKTFEKKHGPVETYYEKFIDQRVDWLIDYRKKQKQTLEKMVASTPIVT